jgi:hypothetical protein
MMTMIGKDKAGQKGMRAIKDVNCLAPAEAGRK